MPHYKLIYFNFKARAEIIRLIFARAGVEYEDFRIELNDWPKYKPQMLYYQMPILEEDGKPLAQSEAIAMYLGKKFGLVGENEWENAKVQELLGLANDVISFGRTYFFENDEGKKKQYMAEFEKDHLVPIFKRLDETLAKNGTGYFVGKKLTAADLDVFHIVDWFGTEIPNSMNGLNHLKEFHEKIGALPEIKKWIETRPKTPL